MLHQLILAGGSGTRFWPKSRAALPKQVLSLDGGPSLLEQAAGRLGGAILPERIFIVTTALQAPLVRERLPEVPAENVIAEPCGRDTAAALGLGAATILRRDAEATIVATPADHVISPQSKFRAAVDAAARVLVLRPEAVVTIGIRPDYPATAYGYIERGAPLREEVGAPQAVRLAALPYPVFRVARFREKPDRETAEGFLASGGFFWNAGIFIWRAKSLLASLDRFLPETGAAVRLEGEDLAAAYSSLRKISIDFAVLERHEDVLMIEADFAWSDLGSWNALPQVRGTDAEGNTVVGAPHLGIDSHGLVVVGDLGRLVVTIGLEDLVIVDTADALLICRKERVEEVKKITERLEREGRRDLL